MPTQPPIVPTAPKHAAPPRAKTSARGYGTAHRKARAAHLAAHPVCQHCRERFATDLHHIDGNTANRAPENLLAVCEGCHHGAIHRR